MSRSLHWGVEAHSHFHLPYSFPPEVYSFTPNGSSGPHSAMGKKNGATSAPFLIQAEPAYLFLFAIMSWISGARISSMAKPILAPGTTMVLRRDMKEFRIMFKR